MKIKIKEIPNIGKKGDRLVEVTDPDNEIGYGSDFVTVAQYLGLKAIDVRKCLYYPKKYPNLNGYKFKYVDSITLEPIEIYTWDNPLI